MGEARRGGEERSPGATAAGAVPLLRADLVVGRGAAPGMFELRDAAGTGRLPLCDFELSVARMLDGRRSVADVVENGARLGIPVDADGLGRFVDELGRHGFLAPPGAVLPAGEAGPWSRRRAWDPATRAAFQDGLRLVRQGRPDEAVPHLRAVLARDPGNAEAHELLALVAAGHALAARPIGEVFGRIAPAPAPSCRPRVFAAAAALGVVLVAALAASRDVPAGARAPAPPGEPAGAGRSPATWRTTPVERRWHPALAEVRAPASGQLGWSEPQPLRAAPGQRLGEVRAEAPSGGPDPAARRRLEELERLAAEDPVYQEFLERERSGTGLAPPPRAVAVVAPAAGLPTRLVRPLARVAAGELVARIVDGDTWHLEALLPGAAPGPGAACEVAGDGDADRAPCRVIETRAAPGQVHLVLSVPAAAAPWLELARSPWARLGPAVPAVAAGSGR